jgi:hypothetical protein
MGEVPTGFKYIIFLEIIKNIVLELYNARF